MFEHIKIWGLVSERLFGDLHSLNYEEVKVLTLKYEGSSARGYLRSAHVEAGLPLGGGGAPAHTPVLGRIVQPVNEPSQCFKPQARAL